MKMEALKRKRAPNFTPQEKYALLGIITKYANILENKKTNQVYATEKIKTWEIIEAEFNATSTTGVFRTWQNLKLFYENRKKEVRKNKAMERMDRMKTGGGPPVLKIPNDDKDTDELISSIMNEKTISGLENPFDCDTIEVCRST